MTVDTSGRLYDDFSRLLFLHIHREESDLILGQILHGEDAKIVNDCSHHTDGLTCPLS
jgi:hypothetical protein